MAFNWRRHQPCCEAATESQLPMSLSRSDPLAPQSTPLKSFKGPPSAFGLWQQLLTVFDTVSPMYLEAFRSIDCHRQL